MAKLLIVSAILLSFAFAKSFGDDEIPRFSLKLIKNGNINRGRLSLTPVNSSESGSVCSIGFNDDAALVACRQLGFSIDTAFAIPYYADGEPLTYAKNFDCSNATTDLNNCTFEFDVTGHACHSFEAVGLDCTGNPNRPFPPINFTLNASQPFDSNFADLLKSLNVESREVIVINNKTNISDVYGILSFTFNNATNVTRRHNIENSLLTLDWKLYEKFHIIRLINNMSNMIKDTLELSLTHSKKEYEGKLAIRPTKESALGSVCDDGFDENAANAACRTMGFPGGGIIINNRFDKNATHFFVDDIYCGPNDTLFQNCSFVYNGYSKLNDCNAFEGVAVRCRNSTERHPLDGWETRLTVGTMYDNIGRLEVRPEGGEWGTVCWDFVDENALLAACRSHNFTQVTTASLLYKVPYPAFEGPVHMNDIACPAGSNVTLANCTYAAHNTCEHKRDVWVQCGHNAIPKQEPVFKLKINESSGEKNMGYLLVQVVPDGDWGYVCEPWSRAFNVHDATAACRSAGFTNVLNASSGHHPEKIHNASFFVSFVTCRDDSKDLSDCEYKLNDPQINPTECEHSKYGAVYLSCINTPELEYKIVGDDDKESKERGRLMVRPKIKDAEWGTVCSDRFDDRSALAFCRMAVNPNITTAYAIPFYGGGSGDIYLDNVACPKNASSLDECEFIYSPPNTRKHDCRHFEDVGIDCTNTSRPPLAPVLFDVTVDAPGTQSLSGLCNYLKLSLSELSIQKNVTNGTEGFIKLSFTITPRNETRVMFEQKLLNIPQAYLDDYSIYLFRNNMSNLIKETMKLRITTGKDKIATHSGRLLVQPSAELAWGGVCDDGFNNDAVRAVCRSLNFTERGRLLKQKTYTEELRMYLDNTLCEPTDKYYQNCSFTYSSLEHKLHDCLATEGVNIFCAPSMPPKQSWEFRQSEAKARGAGRVELSKDSNSWGRVCFNDMMGVTEFSAACRSLGFTGAYSKTRAFMNPEAEANSNGSFYMDNVICEDGEKLQDCYYNATPSADCNINRTLWLVCDRRPDSKRIDIKLDASTSLEKYKESLFNLLSITSIDFALDSYVVGINILYHHFIDGGNEAPLTIHKKFESLYNENPDGVRKKLGALEITFDNSDNEQGEEGSNTLLYILIVAGLAGLVFIILGVICFSNVRRHVVERSNNDYATLNRPLVN